MAVLLEIESSCFDLDYQTVLPSLEFGHFGKFKMIACCLLSFVDFYVERSATELKCCCRRLCKVSGLPRHGGCYDL